MRHRPRARSQFHRPQRPRLSARSTWARAIASVARAQARACAIAACRAPVAPTGPERSIPAAGSSPAPIGARARAFRSPARRTRPVRRSSAGCARRRIRRRRPTVSTRSAPAFSARIVKGSPAPSRLDSVALRSALARARWRSRGRSRRPAEPRSGANPGLAARTARRTSPGASAGEAASASSRRRASAVARKSRSRAAADSARSRSARKC